LVTLLAIGYGVLGFRFGPGASQTGLVVGE